MVMEQQSEIRRLEAPAEPATDLQLDNIFLFTVRKDRVRRDKKGCLPPGTILDVYQNGEWQPWQLMIEIWHKGKKFRVGKKL